MDDKLFPVDALAAASVFEELGSQLAALTIVDHVTEDLPTEDVGDHVQVEERASHG